MWGREGVQREFFQCKNALLSGAVGRHGTGAAGGTGTGTAPGAFLRAGETLLPRRAWGQPGLPSAPSTPLPALRSLPGLNTPKRAAVVHWRGCLGCPSAESYPCAQGLSFKSFYFNIIIVTHLQLKFTYSEKKKKSSLLLKKYSPSLPNTHMHSQEFLVLLNTTL